MRLPSRSASRGPDPIGRQAEADTQPAVTVRSLEGSLPRPVRGAAVEGALTEADVAAIQRTRGALRIERLTEDLGRSRKRPAAHTRDAFGLTPKRLARIARFHHAIDLARRAQRPDWAGIAVDCGYADQAHLVRDFTSFAGAPPERWRTKGAATPPKQIFNASGSGSV